MVQVRPARYGESHLMSAFRSTPPFGVPTAPASSFTVMVGRVPIFDRRRQVYGYELLFNRSDPVAAADTTPDEAAACVIADGILSVGLDKLTHNRHAFVELTPAFLCHDVVKVLPADRVVIQVRGDVDVDAETIGACAQLKRDGYALALSRCDGAHEASPLLPLADFVKVGGSRPTPAPHATGAAGPGVIASDVQSSDAFNVAMRGGFTHFQGFFFEQASNVRSRAIPRGQIGYLRLLYALNDPNLSLNDLEDVMKHDASLCYRLLRTVNSAGFAQSRDITSIRDALLLVGRDTVRRWASLWVMTDLGADAHGELVTMASIRGRTCELLACKKGGADAAGEGFLLGMCSCLDVILEQPMAAILAELPLATRVSDALIGRDNDARRLLSTVIAYERGDWASSLLSAESAGLNRAWLAPAHADALGWAHQLRQQPVGATGTRASSES
jgi:EAL and modified HD-GYP domain-containing signal transduction protein